MGKSKGRLSVSLISNMLSVAISLGIAFLLTPFLIGTVGKEAYSFYPLANNFVNYITIATTALNSMASRFITIEHAMGHSELSQKYYASVFLSNVFLSAVLFIPACLVVVFLDVLLDVPEALTLDVKLLFSFVFLSMIVNLVSSVFEVSTFMRERMDLKAYKDIAVNSLRGVLFVVLFLFLSPHVFYFGLVSCIAAVVGGTIQWKYASILIPDYKVRKSLFDLSLVFRLIKSGIWNSVNSLGSVLLQSLILLLANVFYGASSAGDMSIAQTLPGCLTTVIFVAYSVMLPGITNKYAEGSKEDLLSHVETTQCILGLVSAPIVCIVIILGPEFFSLWIPGSNTELLQILSVSLVAPLLVHSSMWTVYGLNIVTDSMKKPALVLVACGMANVGLVLAAVCCFNAPLVAIPLISAFVNIAYYALYVPVYAAKSIQVSPKKFVLQILRTIVFALLFIAAGMKIKTLLAASLCWPTFFGVAAVLEVIGVALFIFVAIGAKRVGKVLCFMNR